MNVNKIAISIEHRLLKRLDYFVEKKIFKTRSQAIQTAVSDKLKRLEQRRLAQECEKLDPTFEQRLADEGLEKDREQWPEF